MIVVVPHVGKSHLTRETILSIPEPHRIILIDGSYVADLDVLAAHMPSRIDYVRTETPLCLAANWNLGASRVPADEAEWMFCASDIQWHRAAWERLSAALATSPDAAIVKDNQTNWNVWVVRRWAWEKLAPMDERYKPCGGEDDDVVMKCWKAGLKIRNAWIGPTHLEGGHATRLDIRRQESGVGSWDPLREHHRLFEAKWGCRPTRRDAMYQTAIREVLV